MLTKEDCALLRWNPLESEDGCEACIAVNAPAPSGIEELCPYHKGERAGMEYLGRGMALWAENDFSGDPLDLAYRERYGLLAAYFGKERGPG